MLYVRHIAVTVQVWLTAIMTLVAGLPHFQCLCPDGTTKAVCVVPAPDSCCCNGGCCGKESAKKCCTVSRAKSANRTNVRGCCGGSMARSTSSNHGQQMQAAGCSRSLAAPAQVA